MMACLVYGYVFVYVYVYMGMTGYGREWNGIGLD